MVLNKMEVATLFFNGSSFHSDWALIQTQIFHTRFLCLIQLMLFPPWNAFLSELLSSAHPPTSNLYISWVFKSYPSSLFPWKIFLILWPKLPPIPVIPLTSELIFSASLLWYVLIFFPYFSFMCVSFIFIILWDPWSYLCLIFFFFLNSSLHLA